MKLKALKGSVVVKTIKIPGNRMGNIFLSTQFDNSTVKVGEVVSSGCEWIEDSIFILFDHSYSYPFDDYVKIPGEYVFATVDKKLVDALLLETAEKHNDKFDDGYQRDRVVEQREQSFADIVQPFRGKRLSREFVDLYPREVDRMVKNGVITRSEVGRASDVWNDLPGYNKWRNKR